MDRLGFELLGILPGAEIRPDSGATFIRTGVKISLFNGLFRIRWSKEEARGAVDRYVSEFSKEGTPFIVHTSALSTPNDLGEILKSRGLESQPESTMFTLELGRVPELGPLPDALEVRRVSSWDEVDQYLHVFVDGFSLPPLIADAFRAFYRHYSFALEKTFQSIILFEGKAPVAIASILGNRDATGTLGTFADLPSDLCTMMNLTVLPAARGRGHGLRVAAEAVKFAKSCGYKMLCTTGTPEGMAVYRKAPLQEVGKCQRWVWNPK